jgi:hypothetical protein
LKVRPATVELEKPPRRRLGVDEAEQLVHSRRDVIRRRQAAPFLHLKGTHKEHQ